MNYLYSRAVLMIAMVTGAASVFAQELTMPVAPNYSQTSNPMIESPTWEMIRESIIGDVELLDGEQLMSLDVPMTAADAGTVPFALTQRPGSGKRIKELVIVIDNNPMPLAAKFEFSDMMGDIHLETRVRYDVFSNIRAIVTTQSGETFMVGRFVEAAGGCSSSAVMDIDQSLSMAGQMKMKHFLDTLSNTTAPSSSVQREAQLMIRHPNFTGMQVSADTLEYIGARFINEIDVFAEDDLLFKMTGGFSISEDPSFRFKFRDNGATELKVHIRDTSNATFSHTFPLEAGV